MFRRRFKATGRDMFGRAIDANTTSPSHAAPSPDGAVVNRDLGRGDNRAGLEHPSDNWRNRTNLDLAGTLDAFWRRSFRPELDAQSARVQDLAERAVQLEQAAERFKLAGDEKMAASFAEQAAELRRAGA